MRSPLPFPGVPDRPYKILLVQVGTLSFSHPSFGVSVVFIYLWLGRQEKAGTEQEHNALSHVTRDILRDARKEGATCGAL